VLLVVASLPLGAMARRRALAVGLVTQSWGGWLRDVVKSAAIGAALAGSASAGAIALMRRLPRGWWIPGACLGVALEGLFAFAWPVLLAPRFNRFTPLRAGALRDEVLELGRRAGVAVRQVYEVDASRRTTAVNAYVAGLGATKRVVLYDNLLEQFSWDETRLVVAHELAHVRHRDVPNGLLYTALVSPIALWTVSQLTERLDGYAGASQPATLPALALAGGAVSALVGFAHSSLSRGIEARADAFALRLTDAPGPFISFERRIALRNIAEPDPPRLLSLLATHPSTVQRIGIARAYEAGAR
jgi:STE24 endopeptidase